MKKSSRGWLAKRKRFRRKAARQYGERIAWVNGILVFVDNGEEVPGVPIVPKLPKDEQSKVRNPHHRIPGNSSKKSRPKPAALDRSRFDRSLRGWL